VPRRRHASTSGSGGRPLDLAYPLAARFGALVPPGAALERGLFSMGPNFTSISSSALTLVLLSNPKLYLLALPSFDVFIFNFRKSMKWSSCTAKDGILSALKMKQFSRALFKEEKEYS
jgi:hypothetical protein